jgi:hypothetical protein
MRQPGIRRFGLNVSFANDMWSTGVEAEKLFVGSLETKATPVLEYVMMYSSPKLNEQAKQTEEVVGP